MPLAYSILAGREVDTASEEWRRECEAKQILAIPDRQARNEHLFGRKEMQANGAVKKVVRGIADHRGQAAAEAVKADCMTIHNARTAAAGQT